MPDTMPTMRPPRASVHELKRLTLICTTTIATCLCPAPTSATGAQAPKTHQHLSDLKAVTFRLAPGSDLKLGIDEQFKTKHSSAGLLLTCVGSLTRAHLRFAGKEAGIKLQGPLEIVSLVGTLGSNGHHLHLAVANSQGKTFGGHLLEGSTVFTTAEVVIGLLPGYFFERSLDPRTGYRELAPAPRRVETK